jgi:hypothetical protein
MSYCVAVELDGDRVLVTDTKLGAASPVLAFTPLEWASLLLRLVRGDDIDDEQDSITVDLDRAVWVHGFVALVFTPAEWSAFLARVESGGLDVGALAGGTR